MNMKYFGSIEDAVTFTTRVLYDTEPTGIEVDAVFLFAQTRDNQASVLNRGAQLYHADRVHEIAICNGNTETGYLGYRVWYQELLNRGVRDKGSIVAITIPNHANINTLSEAQALIRHAKSHKWEYIYITSSPFHQLRAFISSVSVATREYPYLRIHNKPGIQLDWKQSVRHSQGTLKATRLELIKHELGRIDKYHESGDLIPFADVLDYLDKRDSNN